MSLAAAVVVPPQGLVQWITALAEAAGACTWLARRLFP